MEAHPCSHEKRAKVTNLCCTGRTKLFEMSQIQTELNKTMA